MTLKVQLNGTKQSIFKPSKPLITFISGVKTKLKYGYTFVNGVKKRLWGFADVKFDVINVVPSLYSPAGLFYIDDSIALYNSAQAESGTSFSNKFFYIKQYDISNLNNPVRTASYGWGRPICNVPIETAGNVLVFYSAYLLNSSSSTLNKVLLNTDTKALSVAEASNISVTGYGKKVSSGWLYNSGNNWYVNGSQVYSAAVINDSITSSTDGLAQYVRASIDSDALLYVSYTGKNVGSATASSGAPIISDTGIEICSMFGDNDNRIVVAGNGGWAVYNGTTLLNSDVSGDTKYRYTVLGRIDDFYYILGGPKFSSAQSMDSVLLMVSRADGSVYQTITPPARENIYDYGKNARVTPFDGSQKGYLGFLLPGATIRIQGA